MFTKKGPSDFLQSLNPEKSIQAIVLDLHSRTMSGRYRGCGIVSALHNTTCKSLSWQ